MSTLLGNNSLNADDVLGHTDDLQLPTEGGKRHRRYRKTQKKKYPKKHITVGKIYANWCGHCQALKPEWTKMRDILSKKRHPVYYVEIEESQIEQKLPALKQKYGVDVTYSGFPTLFLIDNGKVKYYNGNRTSHEMANWVMSGGQEPTIAQNSVLGFYGGKPRKQRKHAKTAKVTKKPIGFLGFFFGHKE